MERDNLVFEIIEKEYNRQKDGIELIASENFVSEQVMEAMGSCMTNKYAEGYPGKRYYGGCEFVDVAEALAIERVKKLFGADYANVRAVLTAQRREVGWLANRRGIVGASVSLCLHHGVWQLGSLVRLIILSPPVLSGGLSNTLLEGSVEGRI